MRVPLHLVEKRRERLAGILKSHRYLPVQELCRRLGISEATARRDLTVLEGQSRITRTFGGALSDYNDRFVSFQERRSVSAKGKQAIAEAAMACIPHGGTCFLDAGSTLYFLAMRLRDDARSPLTVVTNNLPVAEVLGAAGHIRVFLAGGLFLGKQSALLGPQACQAVAGWRFDVAFLGAQGMTSRGIFNSQKDVVTLQRAVLSRATRSVICMDAAKLGRRAPELLARWSEVDQLLGDFSMEDLKRHKISLRSSSFLSATRKMKS